MFTASVVRPSSHAFSPSSTLLKAVGGPDGEIAHVIVTTVLSCFLGQSRTMATPTPIPQPPGVPLLGNIFDVDPNNTWWSLKTLSEKYGEWALALAILGQVFSGQDC